MPLSKPAKKVNKPMELSKDKKKIDIKDEADSTGTAPLIVGHKSSMQPKQATAEDQKPNATPTAAKPEPSTRKNLKPIADSQAEEKIKPEEHDEAPEEAKTTEEKASATEAAVVDAVAEQAGQNKKDQQAVEEDKKQQAIVQKLIEEKKYFVPISKGPGGRLGFLWVLLLAVAIGAGVFAYIQL